MLQLCTDNDLLAVNTQYRKQENKLATWRKIGADRTSNPTRENHDQIDFWLAGRRWRNMIKDAEVDYKANIDSDNYPLEIACRFALKRLPKPQHPTPRPQFNKCDETTAREINEHFQNNLRNIRDMTQQMQLKRARETLQQLTEKLPRKRPKHKDTHYSKQTEEILDDRKAAIIAGDIEKFAELTKKFRESKKKDKTDYVIRSVTEDMDPREKWMGIKNLRKEYKPKPYHRQQRNGTTIDPSETAEAFATHLADIWKEVPTPTHLINENKLPIPDLPYATHGIYIYIYIYIYGIYIYIYIYIYIFILMYLLY